MFFALISSSQSGVVGPFAPSQITLTVSLTFPKVSGVSWFSRAQGKRISTSCAIHSSPSNILHP